MDLGDWAVILHRLSLEAWYCSRTHADHFIIDHAYSYKGVSFYICHVNVLFVHMLRFYVVQRLY